MDGQMANSGIDRQNKIADRIQTINMHLTKLNDQGGHICDMIRPLLRAREPMPDTAAKQPIPALPVLLSSEVDCELIVLLDAIIERQVRLIENNDDIIDRIDV